jgi:hypothetical protein
MLRWIKASFCAARILASAIVDSVGTLFAFDRQVGAVEQIAPGKLTGEAVRELLDDLVDQLTEDSSVHHCMAVADLILFILKAIAAGLIPAPLCAPCVSPPPLPIAVLPKTFPISLRRRRRVVARFA